MSEKTLAEPIKTSTKEQEQLNIGGDDFLFHAAEYVYNRKQFFIKTLVSIVVIIVAVFGYLEYLDYSKQKRAEQLFDIEQVLQTNKIANKQNFDLALSKLNLFLHDHASTDEAVIALFRRSYLYAEQKMFVEAEEDLKKVLSILPKESPFMPVAGIYLANILKDQEKGIEAIGILESVRSDVMTDIVLMELAETYLETKQAEKAKQTLDSLLQDFPNSLSARKAKQILSRL